jgi:hypothetical protein
VLAGLVRVIDDGVGRPRDVVEAARSDAGLGALLVAVRNGHLEVCRYLVQGLRVDVDASDIKGLFPSQLRYKELALCHVGCSSIVNQQFSWLSCVVCKMTCLSCCPEAALACRFSLRLASSHDGRLFLCLFLAKQITETKACIFVLLCYSHSLWYASSG